jgi:hypothetical protein
VCFGLNRDTGIKQGQIAHLDGNPSNNKEDNLAFVCFDHHDQYDSTTRQSKNLVPAEVREFRGELHKAIAFTFGSNVTFGGASIASLDLVAGHYIRGREYDSAELTVTRLRDSRYHVTGQALWGKKRPSGPNIGELDFISTLNDNTLTYHWHHPDREAYIARLCFASGGLTVSEENWLGMFGMNVNFSGEYGKAT